MNQFLMVLRPLKKSDLPKTGPSRQLKTVHFSPRKTCKQFSGIIFLNTTGDVLDEKGQAALQGYIHNGGGLAGIHAATDCEYNWPWYNKLIGAYFESHPEQQKASLKVMGNILQRQCCQQPGAGKMNGIISKVFLPISKCC